MRIGILGGGQLAMMMVESANKKFGFEFIVVDPAKNPPASKYAKCIQSQYDDIKTLDILSSQCDLVTIDFENVPSESLRHLEKKLPVFPNPTSLDICQDRLNEKNLFKKLNIATTNYKSISSKDELKDALDEYSFGSILKSRKLGYDGKNQIIIDEKGLDRIWDKIDGVDSIIENKIDFDTEVSLIGARTHDKKTFFYPLIENFHENGILSISISPLSQEKNIRDRLQIQAEAILNSIMNELNYIGVLVIEFFLDKDLNLLANEMAPRVHNSGHWTIQGCNISQFEAHIRAISGKEINKIVMEEPSAMVNILSMMPGKNKINLMKNIHLYDYGKKEKNNRKLGHITITEDKSCVESGKIDKLRERIYKIKKIIS